MSVLARSHSASPRKNTRRLSDVSVGARGTTRRRGPERAHELVEPFAIEIRNDRVIHPGIGPAHATMACGLGVQYVLRTIASNRTIPCHRIPVLHAMSSLSDELDPVSSHIPVLHGMSSLSDELDPVSSHIPVLHGMSSLSDELDPVSSHIPVLHGMSSLSDELDPVSAHIPVLHGMSSLSDELDPVSSHIPVLHGMSSS